jgi:hypothetical protein
MKRSKWLTVVLSALVLTMTAARCGVQSGRPFSNPPATFQEFDLVGIWETDYWGTGVDRLIIKADGTFKQIYQDRKVEDYAYKTPWNEWWVERLPDGRVWVHLQGARYYLAGIRIAEREGLHDPGPEDQPDFWGEAGPPPRSFYDPFGKEFLEMVGKLVINVRSDSSGKTLLHHMWTSSDRGFAIIGGEAEVFRRVEEP